MNDNFRFMNKKIAEAKNSSDPTERQYWYHVSLILDQVNGMFAGYLKALAEKQIISVMTLNDLFRLQLDGDIDDLSNMWNPPQFSAMSKFVEWYIDKESN